MLLKRVSFVTIRFMYEKNFGMAYMKVQILQGYVCKWIICTVIYVIISSMFAILIFSLNIFRYLCNCRLWRMAMNFLLIGN